MTIARLWIPRTVPPATGLESSSSSSSLGPREWRRIRGCLSGSDRLHRCCVGDEAFLKWLRALVPATGGLDLGALEASPISFKNSIIIANGTQQATAQHIPTRLTTMMAWKSVLMKNVEKVSTVKRTRAPDQIFRSINGILGSLRGFPFLAASARHSCTVFLNRVNSASSSSSPS